MTKFCVDTSQNQETKSLTTGPPPLQSSTIGTSYKRDNEVLHQRGKSLGDEQ
jgi:hypothetical protein